MTISEFTVAFYDRYGGYYTCFGYYVRHAGRPYFSVTLLGPNGLVKRFRFVGLDRLDAVASARVSRYIMNLCGFPKFNLTKLINP